MRLLFAEDESDLNRILSRKLTEEGYTVDSCLNGAEALEHLLAHAYDGAILDVMMPRMDGFQVLREIRDQGIHTPVLFLTAKDAVSDRVRGLDAGASDYLIKPFSMEELLARIRALVRRPSEGQTSVLRAGDLTMDLSRHLVSRGGEVIDLTPKEYTLLFYLMRNQNMALSREQIEDHIWNGGYEGGTNVVDVYISYLRRKIDEGHAVKLIHTVRGVGYMLQAEKGGAPA